MVGSSKILTVSYGTFSCTLEGFDESFETMKAIAEYFRDLAADDRYFGAEPPTPDADMLARIAEREIARRVEAHEHEGRIVLRAQDNATTGKALAAALGRTPAEGPADEAETTSEKTRAPETATTPEMESEPAEETAPQEDTAPGEDASPEEELAPVPEATQTEEPSPETAATPEEEAAHEAAFAPGPEAAFSEPSLPGEEPVQETAAAHEEEEAPEDAFASGMEVASEAAEQDETSPEANVDFAPDAPGIADAPDAEYAADESAALAALEPEGLEREGDALVEQEDDEETAPPLVQEADELVSSPAAAETDDLKARLDLIRSVVGASDNYDEDEHAQDFEDASGMEPIGWDAADDVEDAATQPAAEDAESALTEDAAEDAVAEDDQDTLLEEADDRAAQEDRLFEDTLAALLADARPENAQADAASSPDAEAAPAQADEQHSARVVKVSRADVEAAHAEGLMESPEAAGEDTVNIFGDESDALSPEDEAELQRELASLDAELGDETGLEDEAEADGEPEAVADRTAPALEPEQPDEPAAQQETGKQTEVSRIFDETDSQMAEPGSVRRRNTIQHLRAALAATRAEKEAGADLAKKVDTTPYRGDLEAAVRPRRAMPAPDVPRSARPEEPRPAPLKLVAEQRVDTQRTPVRPRRVTRPQAEVVDAQGKGFIEFADEMGASDLPDLLEAAAAYLADVEGRSQFSRPMLMGKLREIDEEGFSREDGLRSFGQLLREGKLQKLSGGRFAVTEETEFRAAARRRVG